MNHDLNVNGFKKRIKLSDANLQVVIIGNFDINSGSINPSFHQTGWWYDHFNRDSINVTDVNASINLEPGEWHLYTSKPLATAINLEEIEYNSSELIAYPNPFNGEVYFESSTNETITEIKVLDNLGRVVYSEDFKTERDNKIKIELLDITSGIYIYEVKTTSKTFTGKIIKTN